MQTVLSPQACLMSLPLHCEESNVTGDAIFIVGSDERGRIAIPEKLRRVFRQGQAMTGDRVFDFDRKLSDLFLRVVNGQISDSSMHHGRDLKIEVPTDQAREE